MPADAKCFLPGTCHNAVSLSQEISLARVCIDRSDPRQLWHGPELLVSLHAGGCEAHQSSVTLDSDKAHRCPIRAQKDPVDEQRIGRGIEDSNTGYLISRAESYF
jgi:hypothetical protein